MSKTAPRCSKCGGSHLILTEVCEEFGTIEQVGSKLIGVNGSNCRDMFFNPGFVVRVDAECFTCGHTWKTRMCQITDHPDYDGGDE